jgi:hypothetical protein
MIGDRVAGWLSKKWTLSVERARQGVGGDDGSGSTLGTGMEKVTEGKKDRKGKVV